MIFTSRTGALICTGPDHATDGRPLSRLSRDELIAELHWREEQWAEELHRFRRIGEDMAAERDKRIEELQRINGELLMELMRLDPPPCLRGMKRES